MSSTPRFRGLPNRTGARGVRSRSRSAAAPREERYSSFRIASRLTADSAPYQFSHSHPELRLEILGRMDVDPDHQVVEVRLLGPHASEYLEEVRRLPGVTEADVYAESERDAHYRVSLVTDQTARAVRRYRVLMHYPIVLQDGWLRYETVAQPSRIRQLIRFLEKSVGPARIEAVRREPIRPGELGLTPSQEAVFRTALQAGYFNAPRGISLTELARRLDRSKATVSQQLAKIQRRLAESALQVELQAIPTPHE